MRNFKETSFTDEQTRSKERVNDKPVSRERLSRQLFRCKLGRVSTELECCHFDPKTLGSISTRTTFDRYRIDSSVSTDVIRWGSREFAVRREQTLNEKDSLFFLRASVDRRRRERLIEQPATSSAKIGVNAEKRTCSNWTTIEGFCATLVRMRTAIVSNR